MTIETPLPSNNVSAANNTITIETPGVYAIDYTAVGTLNTAGAATLSVAQNGNTIPGTSTTTNFSDTTATTVSANTLYNLNAGDQITLVAQAATGSPTANFTTVTLSVRKLDA